MPLLFTGEVYGQRRIAQLVDETFKHFEILSFVAVLKIYGFYGGFYFVF